MSLNTADAKLAKAQFEWDTLLVVAWRNFWPWGKIKSRFINQLGYSEQYLALLRRAPSYIYSERKPTRAVISEGCHQMFLLLDSCKETKDYIQARVLINASKMEIRECRHKIDELLDVRRDLEKDRMQIRAMEIQMAALKSSSTLHSNRHKGGR